MLRRMHVDWMTPYHVAMRELEGTKLESLLEEARRAIHNRTLELGADVADVREQRAMDDALRQLTLHRYRPNLAA